jgi:hypothetical protein
VLCTSWQKNGIIGTFSCSKRLPIAGKGTIEVKNTEYTGATPVTQFLSALVTPQKTPGVL